MSIAKTSKFLDFESARDYVRSLGLKSCKEWHSYCKSGMKPDDIPSSPTRVYKDQGWKGWGDWLGTGAIAPKNRQYLDFYAARDYVRTLNLKNAKEWEAYIKSGQKPNNIPSTPRHIYKDKGWVSLGDWLGSKSTSCRYRQHLDFESARDYVRSLGLKNASEWNLYCKSGQKPDNIPWLPYETYKNKGWVSYGDWLGTKTRRRGGKFLDFESARDYVRSLGLKSSQDWNKFSASEERPYNIPSCPHLTYKNKGWKGCSDWIGNHDQQNNAGKHN